MGNISHFGKSILISVIVPVYNAEKYLDRCLNSILAQSYTNFELILINDGSTDNSFQICEKYKNVDKRVKVINKDNTGVADTRNVGIDVAKGEYISFVDSDDYIDTDMLEKMLETALENNSDIVLCDFFIDDSNELKKPFINFEKSYVGNDIIKNSLIKLYYGKYQNGLFPLWNKLIKKSIYKDNRVRFDTSLKRGEDALFVLNCLKCSNRIDYISKSFYYYYQNNNSIMHKTYDDQYEKWVYMRKLLLKENKNLKFDIDYFLFYNDFIYKVTLYCRDLVKFNNIEKAVEIMNDDFYLQSLKFGKKLPLHIKIIDYLIIHKKIKTTIFLYKLWSKL